MSKLPINVDRILDLAGAICDESASQHDIVELDSMMLADYTSRYHYLDYCRIHVALRLDSRAHRATQRVHQQIKIESLAPVPTESDVDEVDTPSAMPYGFLTTTLHGTIGYFSEGMPLAYLLAAVVTGLGLWIGSLIHVSGPEQIARNFVPSVVAEPRIEFVGRITGMVDCRWKEGSGFRVQGSGAANQKSEIKYQSPPVALGDKFVLASGLMEITYDTGARVLLQGPVTYEVESPSSGFLSLGKLTARVEKKVASGQWLVASNSQIDKSQIPNSSSLSTNHYPLFTIKTPTAVVTDLGTEFGVEVPERGDAIVHVFEGKVDCRLMADSRPVGTAQRIAAGQTARITAEKVALDQQAAPKTRFVRVIHRLAPAAVLPKPDALAYWRFEEDVPPGKVGTGPDNVQHDAIRDWANRWNHLNFYPGLNEGNCVSYAASSDVPPKAMFHPGYSGGLKSFNSGALDPHKTSVLFHNADMHGYQFNFDPAESFTIEGFFKTAGDQSAAGMMAIVYKGCMSPAYMVSVNRPSPGAVQFTLFDSGGKEVSTALSDRNYADGLWHYFAARYAVATYTVSLLVGNEDRSCLQVSSATTADFTINTPPNNLFIGRKVHVPAQAVEGHFRGLIDEIRICREAIADRQLLFAPKEEKDQNRHEN